VRWIHKKDESEFLIQTEDKGIEVMAESVEYPFQKLLKNQGEK
jgi:hypothetical protein